MNKIIIALFFIYSITGIAQNDVESKNKIELGTEFQLYPVGYMTLLTSNVFLNEKWALRFRIGGNFADRQDFSEYNDDETAKGFGGSVGIVRYYSFGQGNFMIGATMDVWNMWTDWKDGLNTSNPTSGQTYHVVWQPWINAGYLYDLSDKWNAGVSLGFGREINVITRGESVGQGWMGIATISLNYAIN